MLKLVLVNILLILMIFGVVTVAPKIPDAPYLALPLLFIILFTVNLIIAVTSAFGNEISDGRTPGFKEFFSFVKPSLKPALFVSAAVIIQVLIIQIVIPYYNQMGGVLGLLAVGVMVWICLYWWVMMQYFYPVYWQMNRSIVKAVKKSALITLDNTLFTIGMGIASILILAVSAITVLLVPGLAAVFMWQQTALRLRLLKYDYLEENPEANRKKIPWEVVLVEQREKVGSRSLRNLIFPWKD